MRLTSTDGTTWTTASGAVFVCGLGYTATVTRTACEGLCLTLVAPDGVTTYPSYAVAAGRDWATFAVGHPSVCNGEPADCGRPASNLALLRVAWACCDDPAGWDGAGWYCVRAAGAADPCEPVELLDEDRCDCTIEICSGPHASEAAAAAVCPPPGIIEVACANASGPPVNGTVSRYFTFALSGVTGGLCGSDCAQLNRTWVAAFSAADSGPLACVWGENPTLTGCLSGTVGALSVRRLIGGTVDLTLNVAGDAILYQTAGATWDGKSALTIPFVSATPSGVSLRCTSFPASITIAPVL